MQPATGGAVVYGSRLARRSCLCTERRHCLAAAPLEITNGVNTGERAPSGCLDSQSARAASVSVMGGGRRTARGGVMCVCVDRVSVSVSASVASVRDPLKVAEKGDSRRLPM